MRLLTLLLAACGSAPAMMPPSNDTPDAPASSADASVSIDAAIDAPPPVMDPCFPSPHAGYVQYACNGITFDVEVPAACMAGNCGVIVDVHGLTMSAAMEDANDQLRSLGGAAGFIVIQPNANPAPPEASWNTTDDPTIFDFLTRAIAVYRIDPKRVHMTGFSQGGFMTWRFLCAYSDTFASVAPAAGASNCVGTPACSFTGSELPAQQIPVLYMHGTQDTDYVPFSCAQPQVDAAVAAWGLTDDGIVASDTTYRRHRYSNSKTVLEFLSHDYTSSAQIPLIDQTKLLGHCFPGSTDPGGQPGQLFPFGCDQTASFAWGAEVVAFFQAHPRP